jgi:hypothetical protein
MTTREYARCMTANLSLTTNGNGSRDEEISKEKRRQNGTRIHLEALPTLDIDCSGHLL